MSKARLLSPQSSKNPPDAISVVSNSRAKWPAEGLRNLTKRLSQGFCARRIDDLVLRSIPKKPSFRTCFLNRLGASFVQY